jgi:hypothetical protein
VLDRRDDGHPLALRVGNFNVSSMDEGIRDPDWPARRILALVSAQIVEDRLEVFKELPLRGQAASFTINNATETIVTTAPRRNGRSIRWQRARRTASRTYSSSGATISGNRT